MLGLRPVPRKGEELNLAGLAIAGFDGVHQARADFGAERDAIGEDEDRLREVEFEQRFGS